MKNIQMILWYLVDNIVRVKNSSWSNTTQKFKKKQTQYKNLQFLN